MMFSQIQHNKIRAAFEICLENSIRNGSFIANKNAHFLWILLGKNVQLNVCQNIIQKKSSNKRLLYLPLHLEIVSGEDQASTLVPP